MMPRNRRRIGRGAIIVLVIVVIGVLASLARFYTDVLWFDEVGFTSVLWTSLRTEFMVGLIVGALAAAFVWANLLIAGRAAPAYRMARFEVVGRPDPLDRYRDTMGPYVRWL